MARKRAGAHTKNHGRFFYKCPLNTQHVDNFSCCDDFHRDDPPILCLFFKGPPRPPTQEQLDILQHNRQHATLQLGSHCKHLEYPLAKSHFFQGDEDFDYLDTLFGLPLPRRMMDLENKLLNSLFALFWFKGGLSFMYYV